MVNDIIMPLVTWATGAASLADLSIVLRETTDVNGEIVKLTWKYGNFLQTVIDFFIIALSVFIMVKVINTSKKKLKELGDEILENVMELNSADKKALRKRAKAEGRKYKELLAEYEAEQAKQLAAEKARIAEEEANKPKPVTEMDVLTEIRDLLKDKK
jgi:large conductance mechanosensitive channel protein